MVQSKDVLLEITSVFGTLLVDCIVNLAEVFDVNDVSAFGVTEAEFTEPPVVIVLSDEMFKKLCEVLVSVFCVVFCGKSGF